MVLVIAHEVIPAGEYIIVRVTDTGKGIAPEDLPRIFEPFFSTKDLGAGTGLGLSTVYGIIKQTGGFIFVESQLNQGTVFIIYLPKYGEDGLFQQKIEEEKPPMADLSGTATILLVEDEDSVRLFSARALRDKGYHVHDMSNGADALALIETGKNPLILSSQML